MAGQLQKTSAYFSRYQVKYRRRREGKTDYRYADLYILWRSPALLRSADAPRVAPRLFDPPSFFFRLLLPTLFRWFSPSSSDVLPRFAVRACG